MPKYKLTLDDGRVIHATAENEADARSGAESWAKANPKVKAPVSTAKDMAKAAPTGLMEGIAGLADTIGQASPGAIFQSGLTFAARTASALSGKGGAPKAAAPTANAQDVVRPLAYQPQTTAGKYTRSIMQNAPNALAPGGLIRKATSVVVPGLTSEAAAQTAEAMGAGQRGQAAARLAGGLIGGAAAATGLIRQPANEQAGMAEATAALEGAGVNVSAVTEASMGRIRDLVRRGQSPREAALHVVATEDLPVAVPLTRGQRSGDPGQQLAENLMLRGARGSGAARQMRGVQQDQQAALRGNTEAIADSIAGTRAPERGAGAARASERLNEQYDAAKTGVNQAYDAARASSGEAALPAGERATASSRIREAVGDFDPIDVAPVFRVIDTVGDKTALTARKLFDARSRLAALQSGGDRTAVAAGKAKGALDNYINEALDRDLFSGDTEAVGLWRQAIGQRREFGRRFQSGDLIEKLTERLPGDRSTMKVDPGDAANYILGRSDMGFVGKQNLYRGLHRLRDALGADSSEWNGIRAEVFRRLSSSGEGAMEGGFGRQFSGANFQKAWQNLRDKDPRLVAAVFTPEERGLIERFAAVATRATSPVRGGDNSSNTAVTAMRLLGNLSFLKNLPFVKNISSTIEAAANTGAARAASSQTVSRAQRAAPRLTVAPQTLGLIGATNSGGLSAPK